MPGVMSAPSPDPRALRLGYLGLLPFVVGAALIWLRLEPAVAHEFVSLAVSAYAALILSFLGGIHWALGMRAPSPEPVRFAWGVVPSLLAWMALLMPPHAGLVVHGVVLVICYLVDRKVYPLHGLSGWLTLRFRLTAVAALSCFVGAAGT